jgi:hypothetical protein
MDCGVREHVVLSVLRIETAEMRPLDSLSCTSSAAHCGLLRQCSHTLSGMAIFCGRMPWSPPLLGMRVPGGLRLLWSGCESQLPGCVCAMNGVTVANCWTRAWPRVCTIEWPGQCMRLG